MAIVLHETGGAQALRFEPVQVGAPAADEVRVRHTAIGVNFHDVYVRSGLYKSLALPGIPGLEAVGVVEAIGAGVSDLRIGDRVGYVCPVFGMYGAYAEQRLIKAEYLLRLPDELDDRAAAATLVKGLTVWMLLKKLRPLQAAETCLVHAAAGGVGRLLCEWASHVGARVLGTVGSEEKAAIALRSGCSEAILYKNENFTDRVRELTHGRGVDVVYDSVGKDTFAGSLSSLALRGHLINFGQSSGAVPPFEVSRLAEKSNTLSRPLLFHYIATRSERQEMAAQLFQALRLGTITPSIAAAVPLKDAAEAHRIVESRATSGSILLIPSAQPTYAS